LPKLNSVLANAIFRKREVIAQSVHGDLRELGIVRIASPIKTHDTLIRIF
jgi:hypothetical protein